MPEERMANLRLYWVIRIWQVKVKNNVCRSNGDISHRGFYKGSTAKYHHPEMDIRRTIASLLSCCVGSRVLRLDSPSTLHLALIRTPHSASSFSPKAWGGKGTLDLTFTLHVSVSKSFLNTCFYIRQPHLIGKKIPSLLGGTDKPLN